MNKISQNIVFPLVWLFSSLYLEVKFINADNLSKIIGRPSIIIANHISFYDSFLLRLNKHWTRLSVYFMGVTKFNAWNMRVLTYTGVIRIVYALFGVFVVVPGKGIEKNLEVPRKILRGKNQVFIFPEGSVNRTGTLMPFKKGASRLALASNLPILPISFKEVVEVGKKKKIIITIGDLISFQPGTTCEVATAMLQETINAMLG